MLNYAGEIFKVSGSHLGPNMSAIIIGIIQLVGTFTPTFLVDRAGRKVIFRFVILKATNRTMQIFD